MLVDSELPTPFLPITSLQFPYFQAVAHSFARRRSTIPPVFNNFPTLSVATGVVPLSCEPFGESQLPVPALQCLAFYRFRPGAFLAQSFVSFVPRRPPSDCTNVFWLKTTPNAKSCDACPPHSMLYIAIQCTETPFGERFGAIPPTPVD